MAQAKKIIGLSCGRVNGNSEILLKEALMAAEEYGIKSEIIRAMELRVKPCKGCEACSVAYTRGLKPTCTIKDDDCEWILKKTSVEDGALIISGPVYHARPNGYFMCIAERLLPVMFSQMDILKKTRVGGIIGVGGGDWTALQLSLLNIYLQHTRILVDQMQVQYMPSPGAVLVDPKIMGRARQLGKRIAESILMPIEKVKYLGEDTPASCPVCHCNVLHFPGKLSKVVCPVCAVKGTMVADGKNMRIKWDDEDIKYPRFSERGISSHMADVGRLHEKFFKEDVGKVSELIKKYTAYGNIIKP